jgi:MFS family permease
VEPAERAAVRRRVPLVLLGSLVVTGIGQTLLYAVLPLASRSLSLSGFQSSAVFALSALFWSLSSPFWGRISDRSRGVGVLVLGMVGQALSNLAVGVTLIAAQHGVLPHVWVFPLLLILRGINGVLGSAVLPSAQGMALRSAPGRPRIAVLGTIATSWSIGTMAGPGFAAVLEPLGLAAPLLVAAGLSCLAGVLVLGSGRGQGPAVASSAARPHALRFIRRRIWPFMLMSVGVGTANALIAQATGFFVQDRLGLTAHAAVGVSGAALSLAAACSVVAQILAIRLRPAAWMMIVAGGGAVALAAGAVVVAPVAWLLVPALGVAGAGIGAAALGISTAASLMTRANQQGGVAGSLASASSLGAIASALAVMPFYEMVPDLPYIAAATLAAGILAGGLAARKARPGQGALPPGPPLEPGAPDLHQFKSVFQRGPLAPTGSRGAEPPRLAFIALRGW